MSRGFGKIMAESFRCALCSMEANVRGRRSWATIAFEIITLTILFETWFPCCTKCTNKLNKITAILGVIVVLVAIAALVLSLGVL